MDDIKLKVNSNNLTLGVIKMLSQCHEIWGVLLTVMYIKIGEI